MTALQMIHLFMT